MPAIDSLHWPLKAELLSGQWPVLDICLATRIVTVDVCGKFQTARFEDVTHLVDDKGEVIHIDDIR